MLVGKKVATGRKAVDGADRQSGVAIRLGRPLRMALLLLPLLQQTSGHLPQT